MALALHRVVQVVRPVGSGNPTYGLIGQVGEIQDGHVWLYLIRERGAKEFMRVPIGDVAVIGKGRVCSDKPKPDDQTRALVERPEESEDED